MRLLLFCYSVAPPLTEPSSRSAPIVARFDPLEERIEIPSSKQPISIGGVAPNWHLSQSGPLPEGILRYPQYPGGFRRLHVIAQLGHDGDL
jgi:hypothetical protein